MQASIDTTDINRGPIVDNKIEIALFYIFFVVVFSFFFINIFVALIILTFQEQGEKDQGDCELDRNQVRRMRDIFLVTNIIKRWHKKKFISCRNEIITF